MENTVTCDGDGEFYIKYSRKLCTNCLPIYEIMEDNGGSVKWHYSTDPYHFFPTNLSNNATHEPSNCDTLEPIGQDLHACPNSKYKVERIIGWAPQHDVDDSTTPVTITPPNLAEAEFETKPICSSASNLPIFGYCQSELDKASYVFVRKRP